MRLIDADEAIKAINDVVEKRSVEPVRGVWIRNVVASEFTFEFTVTYECNVCEKTNDRRTKYCPNCGVKMDLRCVYR